MDGCPDPEDLRRGGPPSSAIFAWRTVRLHPWEVRVGADVSSAYAERSSAAPCGLLRRTVTTWERLDCAGHALKGHDFHSCSPQPFIPCHPERAPFLRE